MVSVSAAQDHMKSIVDITRLDSLTNTQSQFEAQMQWLIGQCRRRPLTLSLTGGVVLALGMDRSIVISQSDNFRVSATTNHDVTRRGVTIV